MAALAARAMLEDVAYLCHVRNNLRRTYIHEISRSDMTWIAFRIRCGRRHKESFEDITEQEMELTKALNVLSAFKEADRYALDECPDTRPDLFTNWYARMCELCHPNMMAIEAGTKQTVATNTYAYHLEPGICEGMLAGIAGAVFFAQYHFFKLYNDCWAILIKNGETLPRMTPDSDPRIVID